MKHIVWGMVAGLGVAGLLVLGPTALAQGTSGSPSSGQPSTTGSGSSGSSSSGSMGSGASDKMGSGASSTKSGSSDTGSTGSGASASSDTSAQRVSGTVQKFDKDSKELTLANSDKKLKLSDKTMVTKDGKQASTSDIHEGDQVRASYSGSGSDLQVLMLEIVPAETPGSKPAK